MKRWLCFGSYADEFLELYRSKYANFCVMLRNEIIRKAKLINGTLKSDNLEIDKWTVELVKKWLGEVTVWSSGNGSKKSQIKMEFDELNFYIGKNYS